MPATDDAGKGRGASIAPRTISQTKKKEPGIPLPGEGIRFPHPTKLICDVTYFAGHMHVLEETVREWLRRYKVPAWPLGGIQLFDTEVFLSKVPLKVRDEETSERRGDVAEAPPGKVEGNRGRRLEAKRQARSQD